MPNPADGPEERTADFDERFAADFADLIGVDEDDRDLHTTPVRCIVYGHDMHPRTHYCRFCGVTEDPLLRLAMARLGMSV